MVRKGPRREKQFSIRHNRKSLRIAEIIITRLASIRSQKEKHINTIQQHHFLWKLLNGHFCDHGGTPHNGTSDTAKWRLRLFQRPHPWSKTGRAGRDYFSRVELIHLENSSRSAFASSQSQIKPSTCCGSTKHMERFFLFIYWSGTILGSLNLNLSTRPVKNMGPKWPTTYHLCQGADNDVWPVGRWWHRKPPSSWDFPCKPLREASLSKLRSRMIRPKMDRLSSWEVWKCASHRGC